MKKFPLIAAIVLMAGAPIFTSCGDDDDPVLGSNDLDDELFWGEQPSNNKYDDEADASWNLTLEGAVDLGLSVKWAAVNVGATVPEGYGAFYAWGDTLVKSNYGVETCTWFNVGCGTLKSKGVIAADSTLEGKWDVAFVPVPYEVEEEDGDSMVVVVKYHKWRMPTKKEFDELRDSCAWTWTRYRGVYGYMVTGKDSVNTIFLPAAGTRYGHNGYYTGTEGYYWSANVCDDNYNSFCFSFTQDSCRAKDYCRSRENGFSVRAVYEE